MVQWTESQRFGDADSPKVQTLVRLQVGTLMPCKCDGPARQTSNLQDEVRFLGGVLKYEVSLECAGFAREPRVTS